MRMWLYWKLSLLRSDFINACHAPPVTYHFFGRPKMLGNLRMTHLPLDGPRQGRARELKAGTQPSGFFLLNGIVLLCASGKYGC